MEVTYKEYKKLDPKLIIVKKVCYKCDDDDIAQLTCPKCKTPVALEMYYLGRRGSERLFVKG